MFAHDTFVFPKLTQRNLPSGRVYEVASTGESYPSITRILGARPKPHLAAWKKRVGVLEAQRISQQATTRGTSLHTLCEHYLDNTPIEDTLSQADDVVRGYWTELQPWMDAHIRTVHAQECDVFSRHLKVAGRLDLLATIDEDDLAIIDFKNSRRPKLEHHIRDYYLQGTFYSLCIYELTGRKIRRIVFPIVSPMGLQIFETKPSAHYHELRQRIDEYYTHYAPSASEAVI